MRNNQPETVNLNEVNLQQSISNSQSESTANLKQSARSSQSEQS